MHQIVSQFPTEELIKEVENSIVEFKRQNQEYDEDRVKEQVKGPIHVLGNLCCFSIITCISYTINILFTLIRCKRYSKEQKCSNF